MYIRARAKALSSNNILSGWRSAGLVPLAPMKVLETLPSRPSSNDVLPHTPPDLSPLESSPLDGTELHEANALPNLTLRNMENLPKHAQRYTERMTQAYGSF